VIILRWMTLAAVLISAGCGGGNIGFGCPGADPAPPPVSGTWSFSSPQIGSSDCSNDINQRLLGIFAGPCSVIVGQSGTAISTTDCNNRLANGCVDSNGNIRVTEPLQDTSDGCTLSSNLTLTATLRDSPTTGALQLPITFSGNCGVLTNCTAVVTTSWVKLLQ